MAEAKRGLGTGLIAHHILEKRFLNSPAFKHLNEERRKRIRALAPAVLLPAELHGNWLNQQPIELVPFDQKNNIPCVPGSTIEVCQKHDALSSLTGPTLGHSGRLVDEFDLPLTTEGFLNAARDMGSSAETRALLRTWNTLAPWKAADIDFP